MWGLLEMGGASVQVSVPVEGDAAGVPASYVLDYASPSSGERGRMYTHSFLGLGGEAAQEAVHAALLAERGEAAGALRDPCLPKDFAEGAGDAAVEGTGDHGACAAVIDRALFAPEGDKARECAKSADHCLWNGVPSPELSRAPRLWDFENFFYIMIGTGYMDEARDGGAKEFRVGDYDRVARDLCARPFADVEANYPKDAQPKSYNKVWCFSAAYVHAFLTKGLGLDAGQALTIGNSVGDVGIDWALGAVLQHRPEPAAASA